MEGLHQLEIVILLLAVVLLLTTLAEKLVIPYPILLVIGGGVVGLIPGLPTVTLSPDLVFLVFLPPILCSAAYFTSWREFRGNLRPISMLAVGLVLVTTAVVAVVARAVLPGLGWAEAIALGAIVSPPDAVSATAIGKRLRIPSRVVTILEGESLVNDATALVLYRAAVGAAVGGSFVLGDALLHFVLAAVGGVAIGVVVGMILRWALCLATDNFTELALTLIAPYIAWVLGEVAEVSSVLACVTVGLYARKYFSAEVAPATRLQARAVWDLLIFVLNGFIFILIGLQLGALRDAVPADRFQAVVFAGAAVSLATIVVRLLWVPAAAALPRLMSAKLRARDPLPPWSHIFVTSWTGMRGIVTLAGALALPVATTSGAPFPFRAEIILISFAVILATLVLQGLSLTPIIRALRLEEDHGPLVREERLAREQAASAALGRLDGLAGEGGMRAEHLEQLRSQYSQQLQRFAGSSQADAGSLLEADEQFRQVRYETLTAERLRLIQLRNEGTISDEVLHRLEHELDIEALRMGIGARRVPRTAVSRRPATIE
jgi:Na+/H+ antiporter